MHSFLDSLKVALKHIHVGLSNSLFNTIRTTDCIDIFSVLILIKIGYITWIQNTIQIFKLCFIHYLCINKQESSWFHLKTCKFQTVLYVFPPRTHIITFDDLNLIKLVISNECCHPGTRLPTWASHTQEKSIALRLR